MFKRDTILLGDFEDEEFSKSYVFQFDPVPLQSQKYYENFAHTI